ncbi:MAG: phosphodiester glycosidase family protein [Chitinophagaceae bacterium]|nr:phosphodiester glycosidase family protein [Chitinophagaceae bacterium]
MKKVVLIIINFSFLIIICVNTLAQEKWKTIKPIKDTSFLSELLVYHAECTSCTDAEVDTGWIRLPDSLSEKYPLYSKFNIDFVNEDFFKRLFKTHKSKKFDDVYLVRGKVTGMMPPTKAHGYIPVFDVYQYKLIKRWPYSASTLVDWKNVDSLYGPLPPSVHIFFADKSYYDTVPFRAYYLIADLKDKGLQFIVDTTMNRRLTPSKFYEKNNKPLIVVNTTFFSFATNKNLNAVIKEGELVCYNIHTINGRGKDTFTFRHPFGSAIGISKKREADIAWLYTDSSMKMPYALQFCPDLIKDSNAVLKKNSVLKTKYYTAGGFSELSQEGHFSKWKMETAVGGGPVLVQENDVRIKNNEELKFAGKAIYDKHPRTAMGYTRDGKLIIMVVEGRNKNAAGITLEQLGSMMQELQCWEALNLDGGGSSCMLVNGKETIKVSDVSGQRPVPAVFIIRKK